MRPRLRVLGGVALVAFVVWLVLVALWLVRLSSDLSAGREAADAARDRIGAEEIADREPLGDLRVAASRFAAAHDRAGGAVLAPLRLAPVIGRQLRSVDALSGAAAGAAAAGVEAVERAAAVFDDPAGAGRRRVEQVRELADIVDDVATRLERIGDLGPVDGLLGPLADARNDLAEDLSDLRRTLVDARSGAGAALSLVEGPRRYLVVAANNAEMRAGSGMWLQGGVLVTADGDLTLESMAPLHLAGAVPAGAVRPTGDLEARWGFLRPGDEWRNLMASPRFPASAQLATEMWVASGHEPVDGVLAVDAVGLRAIVAATGPVTVDGIELGADDVLEHLLHDQYRLYDTVESVERREALATLAESAIDGIDDGRYSASLLLRTLGEAVRGRHLLAWATDPVEQRGWEAAGMAGELGPDSLLVSLLNRGSNKLDWFLDVAADLSIRAADEAWDVAVEITLTNRTPAGEPTYVAGPAPGVGLEAGEYRGILAVNVPGDAVGAAFDDVDALAVAGADGRTRVAGFQLELAPGASRTVVLRFRLPGAADHVVVEPSARVPGIIWHYGSSMWQDSQSRTANF